MQRTIYYSILVFSIISVLASCASPSQPPSQQGVQTQQINQRLNDLEKKLKLLEDAAPIATRSLADIKKELDEIKLRVNLVETRPIPSSLSPEDRTLLDNLSNRVKALEPTPTPTLAPGATPTPTRPPTPSPTPLASAADLTSLEKRVNTLEQQVKQLETRPAPTPVPVQTPVQTPTLTPTPTPRPVRDVRAINYGVEVDRITNTIIISGEVANQGNIVASSIVVVVTLYRFGGIAIGGKTTTPILSTLSPGEKTPFYVKFTDADFDLSRYDKFDIQVISK